MLRAHGVTEAVKRVELVTNCRVFGYVFNPVSFYFCFGGGDRLAAVVCDVHNTFGESHAYVLPGASGGPEWRQKKVFHVSPFFTLDGSYRFRFDLTDDALDARIDLCREGVPVFVSRLSLGRRPLSDGAIGAALLRYPLMTARVTAAIHWQALRLWARGATYRPKPPYDPESARRTTES